MKYKISIIKGTFNRKIESKEVMKIFMLTNLTLVIMMSLKSILKLGLLSRSYPLKEETKMSSISHQKSEIQSMEQAFSTKDNNEILSTIIM